MVSIVRVWLVLSLNLVLWLYLIVDYWFNFLSEFNGLFYYTIKFVMFSVWSSLFYFLLLLTTFLFSNLWLLIYFWFFFFFFFYIFFFYSLLLCIVFFFFLLFHLSLSLSPHWQPIIFKIWWWFYDIKFALLVFYSNLVFLNWHLFYIPFFLWCIRCENECFPSITPLYKDNSIYWI